MLHRLALVLAFGLFLTACGGPLVSDPAVAPRSVPTAGVDARNLEAKPRRAPVAVGDPVPSITLLDQKGREVSTVEVLAGGDAVFLFIAGNEEASSRPVFDWVLRNRQMVRNRGAEILIFTPDAPEQNEGLAEQLELRVAMLHDPSGWAARAFGLLKASDSTRVQQPWTVIAGRDARVFSAKPGLYDITEVITTLTVRPTDPDDFRAIDLLKD